MVGLQWFRWWATVSPKALIDLNKNLRRSKNGKEKSWHINWCGDVPGLNIAIKSVVLNSIDSDYEIVGIRRGWLGLLNYNIDDEETHELYIRDLNPMVVRRVDCTGGTFLHTSRANPSRVRAKDTPEFLVNSNGARSG